MRDIRAKFGIPNLPQSAVILTTFRQAVKKVGKRGGGGLILPPLQNKPLKSPP